MKHHGHKQTADTHLGHKVSEVHVAHDRYAGHSVAMFRDKFWLTLVLTIPVVFWSPDVQHWFGYRALSFPGSKFMPGVLGTAIFFYGGFVFIRGAWSELAGHKPGIMTLISLAITVAFGTSLAATLGVFEIDVWWELSSLIVHASGPLAGNASYFAGSWGTERPSGVAPRHCRTGKRYRNSNGSAL
jgi:P-type Cu2+ transporter